MLKGYSFTSKGVIVFLVGSLVGSFFLTIAIRIAVMQYQSLNSRETISETHHI